MDSDNSWVSIKEAAVMLGVTYNTMAKYVRLGVVKAIVYGNSYRIDKSSVDKVVVNGFNISEYSEVSSGFVPIKRVRRKNKRDGRED